MRDWPPCPPIQRGGGRRSRPGVTPFISALTVARCPATFPGVWPQLRDTLSTSRSVGRGTGAFIYALSAAKTSPLFPASQSQTKPCFLAVSNALALSSGNDIFTATPTERITHYTLLRKVVCQMGALPPLETPHKKRRYATPLRGAYRLFLLSSPPAVSVEQKSAWEWCGIFI